MKHYTTSKTVAFGPGTVLALSEAQAKLRAGQLQAQADGSYLVTGRVEFKAGEQLGLAAAPDRNQAQRLEAAAVPPRKGIPKPPAPGTST